MGLVSSCSLTRNFENKVHPTSSYPTDVDCIVCERILLFQKIKELVSQKIWINKNQNPKELPLLYFNHQHTYFAFIKNGQKLPYSFEIIDCGQGIQLLKTKRIDSQPFHMENKMDFNDSSSIFYQSPMMLCSDVETLHKMVTEFKHTEQWLQLVMHEYFHCYQFSHSPYLNFLADTIQQAADTLDQIYLETSWFKNDLELENEALLKAISAKKDSIDYFVQDFLRIRKHRRNKFQSLNGTDISPLENFWETTEGTARYVEYYLAGHFNQISIHQKIQCDSLFNQFRDYKVSIHFEDREESIQRTKMMQAYYYVTGFNLCRLMDKMNIPYQRELFNQPNKGLYEIFLDFQKQ
ncbi:MAG: hypothetical protein IPO62_09735 [Saprospiraceae bacterium]|nr:hypothetical protein [Saprospiraceae bacterium]